jgi:transposase-like protein
MPRVVWTEIEQDYRAIRRRWRAIRCFHPFHTVERALEDVEAHHIIWKGQIKKFVGRDAAR